MWLMRGFNFCRGRRAATLTSVTLVFITAALTAIGVFDRIGRYAAALIVPITGFANSIASAAMEYRSEGFIMGVGARMFQIAGPGGWWTA